MQLDDDQLSSCVSCGLCLPHCPTYRVTGEEALSPRGRIAAMRTVERDGAPISAEFIDAISTCVQCRGCEPACPSGVPYGRLMESTRVALARHGRVTSRPQRLAYRLLEHHRVVLAGSSLLAWGQRLRLVPRRTGLPRLALRRPPALVSTAATASAETWLFLGCVMDAWQRPTHHATAEVLTRMGITYAVPGRGAACCGALHLHAGLDARARRLAEAVLGSMPGDAPILVNSAGCGAHLKDFGHLLGTPEAHAFASRVFDIHEWVESHLERLPAARRHLGPVVIQDPCHLRHVQRTHGSVRTLLAQVADVVELDDDGLCCGAGGAYAALQPSLAARIRDRKVEAIGRAMRRSGASVVASANPGCAAHLASDGIRVVHPMDLLAEALR